MLHGFALLAYALPPFLFVFFAAYIAMNAGAVFAGRAGAHAYREYLIPRRGWIFAAAAAVSVVLTYAVCRLHTEIFWSVSFMEEAMGVAGATGSGSLPQAILYYLLLGAEFFAAQWLVTPLIMLGYRKEARRRAALRFMPWYALAGAASLSAVHIAIMIIYGT